MSAGVTHVKCIISFTVAAAISFAPSPQFFVRRPGKLINSAARQYQLLQ